VVVAAEVDVALPEGVLGPGAEHWACSMRLALLVSAAQLSPATEAVWLLSGVALLLPLVRDPDFSCRKTGEPGPAANAGQSAPTGGVLPAGAAPAAGHCSWPLPPALSASAADLSAALVAGTWQMSGRVALLLPLWCLMPMCAGRLEP
jgi:hypothetical protein